jgi:hypothetical protein
MRSLLRQSLSTVGVWILSSSPLLAQEGPRSEEVANSMGAHTWFIIAAVGAFLAWSISYSLQLQREAASRKKGRENLIQRKEELLGQIADLEERRKSGSISENRYKQDFKDLKYRLSKVLEKSGGGTHAKKTR